LCVVCVSSAFFLPADLWNADERAIRRAENVEVKNRYEAALKEVTAKIHEQRESSTRGGFVSFDADSRQDIWQVKLEQRMRQGYVVDPNGGLAVSLTAWTECARGLATVDSSMVFVNPLTGNVEGQYSTRALQHLAGPSHLSSLQRRRSQNSFFLLTEFVLLDEHAYIAGEGRNPNFPLRKKLSMLAEFEIRKCGAEVCSFPPSPSPVADPTLFLKLTPSFNLTEVLHERQVLAQGHHRRPRPPRCY
jgi:hypothetical protein